jgi:hypothetical protein
LIILDTQVIAYSVGGPHPLREAALHVVTALGERRLEATTTPEVLQEFVQVHSRRRPRTEAVAHARRWTSLLTPLVTTTQEDLPIGLRLFERFERLDAFDALLAAVALRENATALVSADRAFEAVPKLPFVELGSPELERLLG